MHTFWPKFLRDVHYTWVVTNSVSIKVFLIIFKKYFIYLFLERGREGEREGEKHQCVGAS